MQRFKDKYQLSWFNWIEMDEKRAGYICLWNKDHQIHVSLLLLDPDMQNKGYETKAMKWVHDKARKQRSKVTLSSFRKSETALNFYQKLGYTNIGGDEYFVEMVYDP